MSHTDEIACCVDDETKQFAEENLNETDETREQCLTEIKRWLSAEQSNLHARMENRYLLAFLRGCKFDLVKTKKKLINYYNMRRNVPEWFENRDPELNEIQELVKLGVFVPLKRTQEKRLVVIIKVAAHDPTVHKQDNVFKTGNMMMDVAALENVISAQIYGVTAIFDMSGIEFGHAKQMTPSMIKKAVFSWQNYHVRPKQLEFINAPVIVNIVLNIFKSFMTEKMKSRVRVHSDSLESLYKIVNRDILPPEYGGTGDSMEDLIEYWNIKLLSYRNWFLEDQKYKSE